MAWRRRSIWLVVALTILYFVMGYLFNIDLNPLANRSTSIPTQSVNLTDVVYQLKLADLNKNDSNVFFHPVDDITFVSSKQKEPQHDHDQSVSSKTEAGASVSDAPGLIYVLYWTTFFGMLGLEHGNGTHPFRDCPVSNCFITDDKSFLSRSEAIIFHGTDFGDTPPRNLSQKWIFFNAESPQLYPLNNVFQKNREDFNLTMTYRRDSDIYRPYGYMLPLRPDEGRPPANFNFAQGKKKNVAWLVSHCGIPSRRDEYVRELRKYIDVDIYGSCGTLKCERDAACGQMIDSTYKFYLAFENTFCKDYVTEKLFAYMTMNLVVVVMGLANYSAILPARSYIDVRDFDSPRTLAEYLKLLDRNDDLYNEYFAWRQKWRSHVRHGVNYCGMCQVLHSNRGQVNIYPDLEAWWRPVCVEANVYFAGHAPLDVIMGAGTSVNHVEVAVVIFLVQLSVSYTVIWKPFH